MFGKHSTEVLIAGAGPVGMFTALSLAKRGVDVEIVDGQWRTSSRSYALALHPHSIELLADLGLADELFEHALQVDTLAFYDGDKRRAEVDFSVLDVKYPFVLVLPQQALEDALEKKLAEHKIRVKWNHRLAHLQPNGKQALAKVERLTKDSVGYSYSTTSWVVDKVLETRAAYVIGADGHNSVVRRDLDIDFHDLGDPLFFGVFEFRADAVALPEVRVVLSDDTTNVLWPLADRRFRFSFQLHDDWEFLPDTRTKRRLAVHVGEDSFPYLDEAKLKELVAERAPWWKAAVSDVDWSVGVRFERRLAESFGAGHAWLVGDAAHLASPVGVQSMNVGMREASDLSRRLADVLHGGRDATLLETYNKERVTEWRHLLGLEGDVRTLDKAGDWVSRRSGRIVPAIPASGAELQQLLDQIGLDM